MASMQYIDYRSSGIQYEDLEVSKPPTIFRRTLEASSIDRARGMDDGMVKANMTLIRPTSSELRECVPETLRIGILGLERKAGWNGRGSRSINKIDCEVAIEFVGLILKRSPGFPAPRFGPSPRGGVPLTWRLGKTSLTFDIHRKSRGFVNYYQADLDYHSETGSESWKRAIDRLISLRDWCAENPSAERRSLSVFDARSDR